MITMVDEGYDVMLFSTYKKAYKLAEGLSLESYKGVHSPVKFTTFCKLLKKGTLRLYDYSEDSMDTSDWRFKFNKH
ncbi:MAG: hypothetical protein GY928_17645 [Colwellia sp.]|nr:hypothetical protein [Colwellia sp.]